MAYTFILSNRADFRKQLENIIRDETLYEPVCIALQPRQKVDGTGVADYSKPVALFKAVEHKFMSCLAERLRQSVVVVDELISLRTLDPLIQKGDKSCFYAMLMLAFPELQFTFLNTCGLPNPKFHLFDWLDAVRNTAHVQEGKLSTKGNKEWENAMNLCRYPDCQLFDPHGMRETIKNNINAHPEHQLTAPWFPKREHLALCVEDEPSFALFNGYTAFKGKNKCKVVNSMGHLENLKEEIEEDNTLEKVVSEIRKDKFNNALKNDFEIILQYEDLYLNFYDRRPINKNKRGNSCKDDHIDEKGKKLSNLRFRECIFPILSKINEQNCPKVNKFKPVRNIVTVGHDNQDNQLRNDSYISENKINKIIKPGKGIYHLLKVSEQLETLKKEKGKWLDNNKNQEHNNVENKIGHSSPGRLLVIAEGLLKRSECILKQITGVPDAIHAATLALEAKELLACKTPTVALQALVLQHIAEISAESEFYGVEYSLELKERFNDIDKETDALSMWYSKEVRKKQLFNVRMSLLENLAGVFKKYNQFEEELECLHCARKYRFSSWRSDLDGIEPIKISFNIRRFLRKSLKPLHWYLQKTLTSLNNFLLAISLWIILFSLLYHITLHWPTRIKILAPDLEAFTSSMRFFFTFESSGYLNGADRSDVYISCLLTLQGIIAFFHLGIFASHLYIKLSRR